MPQRLKLHCQDHRLPMHYHELRHLTFEQAQRLLLSRHLSDQARVEVILRLSLTPGAIREKQALFESLLTSPTPELQRAAVQALGHLARLSPGMDVHRARKKLLPLRARDELAGVGEDALSDLAIFGR